MSEENEITEYTAAHVVEALEAYETELNLKKRRLQRVIKGLTFKGNAKMYADAMVEMLSRHLEEVEDELAKDWT